MADASSTLPAPHLMPLMRYRDLAEAMSWLERAFGFEKQTAVSDHDGAVIYGQMTYRGSLLMMGAVRDTDLDKLMRQPDEVGDVETQSCYIVVDDADAHYARAVEAGAEIVLEIKSDGLGRRGYSCRDPQGHIWNFGTYNPAKGLAPVAVVAPEAEDPEAEAPAPRRSRAALVLAALLLAMGVSTWWFSEAIQADLAQRLAHEQTTRAEAAYAELAKVRAEKRAADARVAELGSELQTLSARQATEDADAARARAEADRAQKELAEMRDARLKAEAQAATLKKELERQRQALEAANEAKRITEEKLAVMSAAEDARAKETARQERQPDRPPVPLAGAKDHPPADRRAGAPSTDSRDLETSATAPPAAGAAKPDAAEPAAPAKSDKERAKSEERARPAAKRTAKRSGPKRNVAAAPRAEEDLPTYVIKLRDVPWPYNAWYR